MCDLSATKGTLINKGKDEKVSLSTKGDFINKDFNWDNSYI